MSSRSDTRAPAHLPLPPSSSPSTAVSNTNPGPQATKTLVSFWDHPLDLPCILYIPGLTKEEPDDPCDLLHLAPAIVEALGYNSSNQTSGRRPHYYLVHKIQDERAVAWPITSCGRTPNQQESFLSTMRSIDADVADRILPLDAITRGMCHPYPHFPIEQLVYSNSTDVPGQKNPLEGFLLTVAEARFPVAELSYYHPHSFSVDGPAVMFVETYLLTIPMHQQQGPPQATGEGGAGGGSGGRGAGRADGDTRGQIRGYDSLDGDALSDTSSEFFRELQFIAHITGRRAPVFQKVADELQAAHNRRAVLAYEQSEERVAVYRASLSQFEGNWPDPEEPQIGEGVEEPDDDEGNSDDDPSLQTPANSRP
ncbi:hypothetical protein DFH09DRAFT_1363293 [Mycena vulgaris]|nr:hypothetical protein DFH09DRAFT_1363293 [Mycena vulgaris]